MGIQRYLTVLRYQVKSTRKEAEAAVEALKAGKSAGVENIPAELVQAGGRSMIDILKDLENRRMEDHLDFIISYFAPEERKRAAMSHL